MEIGFRNEPMYYVLLSSIWPLKLTLSAKTQKQIRQDDSARKAIGALPEHKLKMIQTQYMGSGFEVVRGLDYTDYEGACSKLI